MPLAYRRDCESKKNTSYIQFVSSARSARRCTCHDKWNFPPFTACSKQIKVVVVFIACFLWMYLRYILTGYRVCVAIYARILSSARKNECIYHITDSITVLLYTQAFLFPFIKILWKLMNWIVYFTIFNVVKCSCSKQHCALVFDAEITLSCFDNVTHDVHYKQKRFHINIG